MAVGAQDATQLEIVILNRLFTEKWVTCMNKIQACYPFLLWFYKRIIFMNAFESDYI